MKPETKVTNRMTVANKLIFLGTGSAAHPTRQMTSLLFSVDGHGVLVDCGDGMSTVRRIEQSGVGLSAVRDVFITHQHADHVIGMPHFLFVKLIREPKATVRVLGPAKALDAVKRISFLTHDYLRVNSQKIVFVPFLNGGKVEVSRGFSVESGRMNSAKGTRAPGYMYSFTVHGQKILFSADTTPGASLARLAEGSNVIIHECGGLEKDEKWVHDIGHSTARDAAELAMRVGAAHLILTHFPRPEHAEPRDLLSEAKRFYNGKITLAEDMMIVPL